MNHTECDQAQLEEKDTSTAMSCSGPLRALSR